jgi:hypothetical protein
MSSELVSAAVVVVALLWALVCSLRQLHAERTTTVEVMWREATADGWSQWRRLAGVSPADDYDTMLTATQDAAHIDATAVQFASMMHPAEAPDYTRRVLFMSTVREPARG